MPIGNGDGDDVNTYNEEPGYLGEERAKQSSQAGEDGSQYGCFIRTLLVNKRRSRREGEDEKPHKNHCGCYPSNNRVQFSEVFAQSDKEEQQSELEQKREKSCEFEHSPSLHPCISECTDFKLFFRVLSGLRQKVPEPLLDEHTE